MLTAQSHITAASGTVLNAPYPAFCVSRATSAYVPFGRAWQRSAGDVLCGCSVRGDHAQIGDGARSDPRQGRLLAAASKLHPSESRARCEFGAGVRDEVTCQFAGRLVAQGGACVARGTERGGATRTPRNRNALPALLVPVTGDTA
jgi:hypothetical protein